MRHIILIGLGITLGLFVLLGMQSRAEAPAVSVPDNAAGEFSAGNDTGQKSVTLSFGKVSIPVLLATTKEERILGLGGRESIYDNEGMLFVFETSDYHGIWMSGMRFPIDIVWLSPAQTDADCTPVVEPQELGSLQGTARNYAEENKCLIVVDIKENVAPETYPTVFSPMKAASYVLEMKGGAAARNDITIGSVLTLK